MHLWTKSCLVLVYSGLQWLEMSFCYISVYNAYFSMIHIGLTWKYA